MASRALAMRAEAQDAAALRIERGEVIAMPPAQLALWKANADPRCGTCRGGGAKLKYGGLHLGVCECVLREVFRACLARYRYIDRCAAITSGNWVCVEWAGLGNRGKARATARTWARRDQDYAADFYLVAKRHLSVEWQVKEAQARAAARGETLTAAEILRVAETAESDWRLFEVYVLLGVYWKDCARILHMNRGNFFSRVYNIQRRLGKVFLTLEPYALFPLDEYFYSVGKRGVQ
jgi:hypothetical protein